MRVEIDVSLVGCVHGMAVMGEELLFQGAEGVEFHAGDKSPAGEVAFNGPGGSLQLGGGVGEIAENGGGAVFRQYLQSPGRAGKGAHGPVKEVVTHSQGAANRQGCRDILEVVLPENLQGHPFIAINQTGLLLADFCRVGLVGRAGDVALCCGDLPEMRVPSKIEKASPRFDELREPAELFHIVIKGGEDVDMVPGDTTQHPDMGMVKVKFGPPVIWGREVLVPFKDGDAGVVAQTDHGVESFDLGSHHVVEGHAAFAQDVHDHGGDGGFAMAAADNHADFFACLLKEKLRVGEDLQAQFPGSEELGVVASGVHAQNDGIEVGGDFSGEPSRGFGQQSAGRQPPPGGLHDLIVGTSDQIPFMMEGQGQIMHGAPSDGNKMDSHF